MLEIVPRSVCSLKHIEGNLAALLVYTLDLLHTLTLDLTALEPVDDSMTAATTTLYYTLVDQRVTTQLFLLNLFG